MMTIMAGASYSEGKSNGTVFGIDVDKIKEASVSINNGIIYLSNVQATPLSSDIMGISGVNNDSRSVCQGKIALIPKDGIDPNAIYDDIQAIASGDTNYSYKTKGDPDTLSCTLYSYVYYTTTDSNGFTYYHLDSINGGINGSGSGSILGSGIVIVSEALTFGEVGAPLGGGVYNGWNHEYTYSNSTRSFSVNVTNSFPSWPAVREDNGLIGATYSVTLCNQRDGITYDPIELTNNPLDNTTPWW